MPGYREGKDSTFTHEGIDYLVDDLLKVTEKLKPENMDLNKLDWILDETTVHKDRVAKADLSFPIVVLKSKKWGYVVLDGVHRLALAKEMNNKTIQIKLITENQLPSPISK
ncbi:hypothetical protein F9Z84_07375 [Escherichia coli]|nr:hypothetical protein F9Z84_07375 [Escherichia coli]